MEISTLKTEKGIVRNFSVFCSESKLRNRRDDIKSRNSGKIQMSDSALKYILSDVFGELADYDTLCHYYSEALQGRENQYFSFADFCDKKHAIRIDSDNNILLYNYQDEPQIGIPWNYPHLIACIGSIDKNTDLNSVMKDLSEMSTLDFLLKYYFHRTDSIRTITPVDDGYFVDGFMKIIIDDHISFKWVDLNHNDQEKYIADPWWASKEDIIRDLTSMNLLKFGKEYIGFWGR